MTDLTAAEQEAISKQAKETLADERWVEWALNESADGNEGALVMTYRLLLKYETTLQIIGGTLRETFEGRSLARIANNALKGNGE